MAHAYTCYWTKTLCDDMYLDGLSGEPLEYTAGARRDLRRLTPGDRLYVVTVIRGDLYLIGRMTVAHILESADDAELMLGYEAWDAELHVLAERDDCTPMYFFRMVERGAVGRLRIAGDGDPAALRMSRDGSIESGALRGIHMLDADSAVLLDDILAQPWYELPHPPDVESDGQDEPEISDEDFEEIRRRFARRESAEALDAAACEVAIQYYLGMGFELDRVADPSIDGCSLLMRKDRVRWMIGVKGVPGPELAFVVNDTELKTAFGGESYEMVVVTHALSPEPGIHRFSGADLDELFDYRAQSYVVRLREDDLRDEGY